jgi:pimeloyl-ACP methyl ester carboxylesterase
VAWYPFQPDSTQHRWESALCSTPGQATAVPRLNLDAPGQRLTPRPKAQAVAADAKSYAERQFFSEGYGEWVASFVRAAGVSGSHGAADDYLATFRDWGFPLADIRQVTIWQGTEDQHVPSFHAEWLRDHLPQAELRTLESEGHTSIVRHLPDIINTLIANGQSAQK